MKIPVSWLKEYVDLTVPIEELAHRLTLAGMEVETIDYIGIPADEDVQSNHLVWDREKIVVGHILEVKPHPDADKLVLAMVDSGLGHVEQVVTGAPNLYPYKGAGPINPPLVTPYAREGATVIDGHKEDGSLLVIKPRKLRGIDNNSMVCSAKELGLWEEHEGILLLASDAAPGTPLQDVLGDAVLDISLTPNLARCFSVLGIAREVAALTGQTLRYPSGQVSATGPAIKGQVGIEITSPVLNPRFTLALIKGVTIAPSPEWMQRRLRLAGMRPINNIVDITNYVMLETGQPLHAFDYDVLVQRAGGLPPTIVTRLPAPGETLTTLDGVKRQLDDFTILVCDTAGALSLGGIMGGAESEISDTTTSVLLEAASWNYINIRKTLTAQREHGAEISSEAGTRFSRGIHPSQALPGLRHAIDLMRQLGKGEIAQGEIDDYPQPAPPVSIDLPMSEVDRLLGIPIDISEARSILERLEFSVRQEGDTLHVTAPDHRMDIGQVHNEADRDIQDVVARADLIEEIARIYGYDRIPDTMLIDELPPQRNNPTLVNEERVRDALVKLGVQEIVTYRFTTPEVEARLTPAGSSSGWPDAPYVALANPISAERSVMRHTLLAGALQVVVQNTRWRDRQALFEIGSVYLPVAGWKLPDEPARLCIVLTGARGLPAWQDGAGASPAMMDFFDLKGIIEGLMNDLHVEDISFVPVEHGSFFPGRTASLNVAGRSIGVFGELHPLVLGAFGLGEPVVLAAEIDLNALAAAIPGTTVTGGLSTFPAIFQDIAVVVDEATPAASVEAVIREAGGYLLKGVRLFDVYRSEQIGVGKKSLAYSMTFQAPDKTLRDKDAASIQTRIIRALESKLGAKLRS
ncbi:MAG: phenylalanine--tRNA ligase subunit beta [Anaerolineae bacterium]|nr:phenylalanine--tRNA ligase subunit beta [Anaerolineae bacterium]